MIITTGVDVGSSAVKVSVVASPAGSGREREGARVLASAVERNRRRDASVVIDVAYSRALEEAGIQRNQIQYVATTGEGELVPDRTGHFYGMTAHARGAFFLDPQARAVLDVGALHARAIRMSPESRVLGYAMTSQCASGSGQFIENIARYLGVTLSEVGELSRNASGAEKVSGICAVLAETDVINMVSRGIPAPNILRGIHLSMADRLAKLLRTAKIEGTVVLTGGLANDVGLTHALQGQLELDKKFKAPKLVTHEDAIYAGAIGAALWGAARYRRLASRKATGARSEATA